MANPPADESSDTDNTPTTVLTADDIAETATILEKMGTSAEQLSGKVNLLIDRLSDGELPTAKGISFLDTKNQLLSQYILDISAVAASKASGRSIEDSANIDRLIQMRTYLERLKPVERKLSYQIEKLVKIATQGGLAANDPLHLKPNPDNMGEKDEDTEAGESNDEESGLQKVQDFDVYRPPKMSSAHYEEEATGLEKVQQAEKKAKKKALNSALMRELREEYSEAPTEIVDDLNLHRMQASKIFKERTDYEESNFIRLRGTKPKATDMATDKYLDTLASFGDISALTGERKGGQRKKKSGKTKRLGKKHGKKRKH